MSPSRSDYTGPPLVVGSRRGYRTWRYSTGMTNMKPPKLWAMAQGEVWQSDTITARCAIGRDHKAPDKNCTCGIYAKYRYDDVDQYPIVIGAVDLHGIVLEGTKGARAEKATIRGLLVNTGHSHDRHAIRAALSETYKAPFFYSEEELLQAFPEDQDIPEEPKIDWGIADAARGWFSQATGGSYTVGSSGISYNATTGPESGIKTISGSGGMLRHDYNDGSYSIADVHGNVTHYPVSFRTANIDIPVTGMTYEQFLKMKKQMEENFRHFGPID